jgi:mono/diheme cytochrome c family protein
MDAPELRKFFPWFTVLGLVVAGLVAAAFYKDQFREWKIWQQVYIKTETARAANTEQRDAVARLPVEIKQYVLPELNRVDRCTTCHIAVEDPSYGGMTQPLAYHPNHAQHPFEKFGCTICHQGQGRATTKEAAHGHVEHWEHPMLPMKYIESACAKCHLPTDVPNPNAKTAQQVPSLKFVADGYTKAEVKKRILNGQREITPLDAKRPPPPLYMPPWRDKIQEGELDDLAAYLFSLKPKGEDVGF